MADATQSTTTAQEDITKLQFGTEFEDIAILSNAQVSVLLQVSADSAVHQDEELNDVNRRTRNYVNRFNTMTNLEKDRKEIIGELDNLQEYVILKVLSLARVST